MIDLRLLRDDFASVATALARRGYDRDELAALRHLDERRRALVAEVDRARADQRSASKGIGRASPDQRPALIEAAAERKAEVARLEQQLTEVEAEHTRRFAAVPNLPHPDAPDGDEGDGVVRHTFGERPHFDFPVRDHVELLESADALDLARAAKVSGARFAYLKGEGALLEFALVRYAIDIAMRHGHTPVIPPVLVREDAMYGTGFLPTDEQQIFLTRDDDYYLVGTSEVPLAALHMDELLDEDELPIRYVGYSPCFRREAGTHGKDTRGILRVHQFEKVELFSFVHPELADDEHERILSIEQEVFTGLEVHAQVVDIPVGDLGASAARKFDIEAWLPGQDAYREVTSCSNTTDYQARRLKARIRRQDGDNLLVHTLNGTALAVQRAIIALVETHQRADGTVVVPAALQPYLGREVLFAR
ncbi:serine--tRNA ligase [Egicoccus halophilus]|uniref:Serine--tRNA ligase n=1 Tax=Egicoccus halophilus TaxID=1670830 RepID=A0A8J3ESP3_9ACTN|nr:serine--tRNA ligase [Egicoccus halophilus]GGI03441.1 serine--tRNA ligase [Egicoccus halophilus]